MTAAVIHHERLTSELSSVSRFRRRSSLERGSPAAKSTVANNMRKGTIEANVSEGVRNNNKAPINPPAIEDGVSSSIKLRLSRSSRRNPSTPPKEPGHSATVLVTFAAFGSMPIQMSAGKVRSVPPPATEFIIPAIKAAANMTTPCHKLMLILVGLNLRFEISNYRLLYFRAGVDDAKSLTLYVALRNCAGHSRHHCDFASRASS